MSLRLTSSISSTGPTVTCCDSGRVSVSAVWVGDLCVTVAPHVYNLPTMNWDVLRLLNEYMLQYFHHRMLKLYYVSQD